MPLGSRSLLFACTVALAAEREIQLLPAGEFAARDGRPGKGGKWKIDAAIAAALIALAEARTTPFVLDYEHQTLHAERNGQPAPAAGWFKTLEWREGKGLYATDVQWTERAAFIDWIKKQGFGWPPPQEALAKLRDRYAATYPQAITRSEGRPLHATIDGRHYDAKRDNFARPPVASFMDPAVLQRADGYVEKYSRGWWATPTAGTATPATICTTSCRSTQSSR